MLFISSFIRSLTCVAVERTQNKYPAQPLLAIEEIAQRSHPIPSHLADVFQMPEGWMWTLQIAADAACFHLAYVDSEMHILAPGNLRK